MHTSGSECVSLMTSLTAVLGLDGTWKEVHSLCEGNGEEGRGWEERRVEEEKVG